jgi:hypothetical protein
MAKGDKIVISLLGGSVTYGSDLKNRIEERWSTTFERLLNSGWYNGSFVVNNLGTGACNVDCWINRVRQFSNADLVLVDLSVNDQGFDLQVLPHLYTTLIQLLDGLPNHPALLFLYAFRTANFDADDLKGHCPNKYDQGVCCGGYTWCKKWYDMQDWVVIALKKYSVPFISYRDLVWPVYSKPPPDLPLFWNGLSHPDYKAHRLMAKLAAFAVLKQAKEARGKRSCRNGSSWRYVNEEIGDSTVKRICPTPLTFQQAEDGNASSVASFQLVGKTEWKFFNDSRRKYGWIYETTRSDIQNICGSRNSWCPKAVSASKISFLVEFGSTPTLQLSFLKSYTDVMGTAVIWIDDRPDVNVSVASKWGRDVRYSVQHYVTLSNSTLNGTNPLITGDIIVLPTITHGRHILNIAATMPIQSNQQDVIPNSFHLNFSFWGIVAAILSMWRP